MMKRKRLRGAVAVLICLTVGVLLLVHFSQPKKKSLRDTADEITGRLEAALGDEWTKEQETTLTPFTYADSAGNTIIYYVISTKFYNEIPEIEGLDPVLNEVVNPDTADSSRSCKVGNLDAMIYEKDDRAFLCWTVSAECSLAIEYSPDAVSESDVFRMAESVPTSNGGNGTQEG